MAIGTMSFLLATSCTISEATADLLALFQLLAKELRYTLLDVEEDDKYLSTSLLAIKLSVSLRVCSTPIMCGNS